MGIIHNFLSSRTCSFRFINKLSATGDFLEIKSCNTGAAKAGSAEGNKVQQSAGRKQLQVSAEMAEKQAGQGSTFGGIFGDTGLFPAICNGFAAVNEVWCWL